MTVQTNCVISVVGRNSLHRQWIKGQCDFDLHLIVYDDSIEEFRKDTDHVCQMKGYKLKNVFRYLISHIELIDQYEYFFIPDDDILMSPETINSLFRAMRHYDLKIAQPSLTMSYYSWPHTLSDRYCRLRYTDFIEMMVPCFSREALRQVLFTFNENETGWGTESHWPWLIHTSHRDMAVIDEIKVRHTRPIQSGQEIHLRELSAYLKKYHLPLTVTDYGSMPMESDEIYLCDRETFMRIRSAIGHWLESNVFHSTDVGQDGWFGYARCMCLYAELTQAEKFVDRAEDLLLQAMSRIGFVKDDMTFRHGITGCCWMIEDLAGKGMLEEDPEEILEEPDRYITAYEEKHQDSLTVMDLAGIGRYWLARLQNRDTDANREAYRNVASLLGKKIKEKGMSGDISVAAYALEVMQGAGSDIKNLLCEFEKHANRVDCTDTERAYTSYRLFRLSHDDFYIMKTREELKNLRPELLTLDDALMLAEVLSYTINTQNTTRL